MEIKSDYELRQEFYEAERDWQLVEMERVFGSCSSYHCPMEVPAFKAGFSSWGESWVNISTLGPLFVKKSVLNPVIHADGYLVVLSGPHKLRDVIFMRCG